MACMLHPPLSEATTVRCRPPRGSLELSGQPLLLLLLLLASHATTTLIMLQEIIQLALAQAAEQS